jgi:hypothetical protein
MPGRRQLEPIEVFEANIADADRLVALTAALENGRKWTRMEKKRALGGALGIAVRDHAAIGCVESNDFFVVIKPKSKLGVNHFTERELRPLLRQAVVAISAAVESYVAVNAASYASAALRNSSNPLKDVGVDLRAVMNIEAKYKRRTVAYRTVLVEYLEKSASPAPSQIGLVFKTVGHTGIIKRVDSARGVDAGTTERELGALAARRNKIAHTGDRTSSGRSPLAVDEVEAFLANAKTIVYAIEAVLP